MTDNGHYKYYSVSTNRDERSQNYFTLVEYGRIGTLQSSSHLYDGPDEDKAILLAREQIRKKIAKGYVIVEER
jgi:predicted DNA-binding WGR domain protein